jgi:chemotaxis protein methyltransferase CheR
MSPDDAEVVRLVVHARSGVAIDPHKTYSIESHLGPIARRDGYEGIGELIGAMRTRRDEALMWSVTEALIPGETSFFRDRLPFELFRDDMLPRLANSRAGQPIRIWSAACSTGQEAYSLCMAIDEMAGALRNPKIDLFATDLSERRLEKAQSGVYSQFEVQRGLPIRKLVRHFEKTDEHWRISSRLREMVRWRRVNLLADLRPLGQFDVIFCRYVLCNLDPALRARVLEQLARGLSDEGWLVLGHGEVAEGLTDMLQPVPGWNGAYARNPEHRAAA